MTRINLGNIYIAAVEDRYKVGRSSDPEARIRQGRTWAPELRLEAARPFWSVESVERRLHAGLAMNSAGNEWFWIDELYDRFLEEFRSFSTHDSDWNTVEFGYWMHQSGMADVASERRGRSLRKWREVAGAGGY